MMFGPTKVNFIINRQRRILFLLLIMVLAISLYGCKVIQTTDNATSINSTVIATVAPTSINTANPSDITDSSAGTPATIDNANYTDNIDNITDSPTLFDNENSIDDTKNITGTPIPIYNTNSIDDKKNITGTPRPIENAKPISEEGNNGKNITEQKPDAIIFHKTSQIVYAKKNVNIRSSCSTNVDNVISVLKQDDSIKRIGFQKVWSKVLYHNKETYIRTEYLTSEKPSKEILVNTTDNNTDADKFMRKLKISSDINKFVYIIGTGGSDCNVLFYTKDDNGKWQLKFSTDGDCGAKGITNNKKEGDRKTPAGLYSFSLAFGIKPDPGALLEYRQVTKYDYWIDDLDSAYYNTWVNSKDIPGDYQSEHLIDHSPQYNYVLNIDYNPSCTPGLGSAIFLHEYNGLGKTTGCIAVSEKYIKILVKEVDSSTRILIVSNKTDLKNY